MTMLCTCEAQLQPHDPLPGVCPEPPCTIHELCDLEPCTWVEGDE